MAATDTASTGDWSQLSTWSSNTSPGSADTLIIPFGTTVTVDCNCGTYSGMYIIVYGNLDFPGGRKINMTSDGVIDVYPNGSITGTNNGDKINIDGVTVWSGEDGPILGPSSCLSSGCGSNATLPTELLYASANVRGNSIEVQWATASETQNDYFLIWRSLDLHEWHVLTQISGSGNSTTASYYAYTDTQVNPGHSYYYRLSQTDFDGSVTWVGHVMKATLSTTPAQAPVTRFASPERTLEITIPQKWVNSKIVIADMAGNVKLCSNAPLKAGYNNIDVAPLGAGIYFVQFTGESGQQHLQRIAIE